MVVETRSGAQKRRRNVIGKGLFWSGLILLAMLAATGYGWTTLPDGETFPVHWNADGEPNRYDDKAGALLVMPATALGLIAVFAVIPLIDPRKENLRNSSAFYLAGWIGGIGVVALTQFLILYGAVTRRAPPIELALAGAAIMLIVLGNYMAKSRSNWFAGLRTPWTMESENAWSAANRFAGWGVALTGLLTIGSLFARDARLTVAILVAGMAASILIGVVVSYATWRRERRPANDGR